MRLCLTCVGILLVLWVTCVSIVLVSAASAFLVSPPSDAPRTSRYGRDGSRAMRSRPAGRRLARRLIVDTDLGLDDLVALALLRVQHCLNQNPSRDGAIHERRDYTNFRLGGVTITPGISLATSENAELLRRLLPPETPVFVSEVKDGAWNKHDKPRWWPRTARRVTSFLSSLPPHLTEGSRTYEDGRMSAEEFVAGNIDDPNVDFLCLAPLSTVARALRLRKNENPAHDNTARAAFHIMGGIRSDSRMTGRGESTAPFGYRDPLEETPPDPTNRAQDSFGEFNFALDIEATREVFSSVEARILPVEACTLVRRSRGEGPSSITLSSMLNDANPRHLDAGTKELSAARATLRGLLREFGTEETQWDSIAAAIYCNAFDSAGDGENAGHDRSLAAVVPRMRLAVSELGALVFPGCGAPDDARPDVDEDAAERGVHHVRRAFAEEDETTFLRYVSLLAGE